MQFRSSTYGNHQWNRFISSGIPQRIMSLQFNFDCIAIVWLVSVDVEIAKDAFIILMELQKCRQVKQSPNKTRNLCAFLAGLCCFCLPIVGKISTPFHYFLSCTVDIFVGKSRSAAERTNRERKQTEIEVRMETPGRGKVCVCNIDASSRESAVNRQTNKLLQPIFITFVQHPFRLRREQRCCRVVIFDGTNVILLSSTFRMFLVSASSLACHFNLGVCARAPQLGDHQILAGVALRCWRRSVRGRSPFYDFYRLKRPKI